MWRSTYGDVAEVDVDAAVEGDDGSAVAGVEGVAGGRWKGLKQLRVSDKQRAT